MGQPQIIAGRPVARLKTHGLLEEGDGCLRLPQLAEQELALVQLRREQLGIQREGVVKGAPGLIPTLLRPGDDP